MLVKCICTNCAGHLEFEEESAGQKIKCPHCGFDTVLFLPGAKEAEADIQSLTQKLQAQRRVLLAGAVVLAAGAVIWAVHRWIIPVVAALLPEIENKVVLVLIAAMICLAIPLLLLWLVFPVVWFFQARRLISRLQGIEEGLRFQPAPPPRPQSTSTERDATEAEKQI